MSEQKSKYKKVVKYIEFAIIILFIGILFTKDLKAEVFGFLQMGLLKIGLFQPHPETRNEDFSVLTVKNEDFKIKSQDDKVVSLNKLDGKVVFINFWATWCAPCVAEMPAINTLYKSYKDDKDVVFLMISLDEDFPKAKKFLDRKGFVFDIYQPLNKLPDVFNTSSLPSTFVLNKEGSIVFNHEGIGNYNTSQFKDFIDEIKTAE